MKVILKTLKQEIYEIEVDDMNINVEAFKQIIQEKINADGKKLKLLYNGKVLENIQIMNEIGLVEDIPIIITNIQKPKDTSQSEQVKEEEKICQTDIKVDEVPQVVASIMKVICKRNPEASQRYFEQLKADNPAIMLVIKKEEAKFKNILYSPVTKTDQDIFKKFYNGEDMNSYLATIEEKEETVVNGDIEDLIAMGYTRKQAEEAYFICENNFDLALNYLLDNIK
jgi:hypothetical protein